MAYTINQLITEYNSEDAVMLSNAVIKNYGILQTATAYMANKQLAHTYTNYATLPTAGIRSLADGVASSTVQGTTVTKTLTLFNANGAWDQAFVNTNLDAFYALQAPLYFNAIAALAEKAIVYGTGSFGNSGYTGVGLHQYVTANGTATSVGGTSAATSIFAVRYSPFQNMDGAALCVDPLTNGGLFYVNENWVNPVSIAGSNGSFMGHNIHFNMNGMMLLPGTNNVAALRGINASNLPTVAQVNSMLNAVRSDRNTVIYCNRNGADILGILGKDGNLRMSPNEFDYSNEIATWNGIPIVITDTILNTETSALYAQTV